MQRITPTEQGKRRTVALLAALLAVQLAGCAGLSGWRGAQAPVPTHAFLLPPEGTDVVGVVQITTARHEDTLLDIARRYDLGYEEIVAANPGVDLWLPGEGTPVVLPTQFVLPSGAREGLVVNLAAMRLFYYPEVEAGQPAKVITHPVGIGREGWLTPQGTMHIIEKKVKPAWTVPESVRREHAEEGEPLPQIVPAGPDNPLGDFAMRLSNPTYLIHGTNQPYGVGLRVSHGCVRLYPEDIERLFPAVPIGTRVRVVNEPYLAGWRDGELYLEAHPPLSEDAERWEGSLEPMEAVVLAKAGERVQEVNWEQAREIAGSALGIPLPIAAGGLDVADLLARAPRVPSVPPWFVGAPQDEEAGRAARSPDGDAQHSRSDLPPS